MSKVVVIGDGGFIHVIWTWMGLGACACACIAAGGHEVSNEERSHRLYFCAGLHGRTDDGTSCAVCVCVCVYVLVDMSKGPGEAAGLRRPGACGGLEASWASALIFSRGTFCSGMGD